MIVKLTRGNFGDSIGYRLHDHDGNLYDLTGHIAKIIFKYEESVVIEKDLTIDSPSTLGVVKFILDESDFKYVGEYKGEILVYLGSTLKKSYGGNLDDSIKIEVVETFDPSV